MNSVVLVLYCYTQHLRLWLWLNYLSLGNCFAIHLVVTSQRHRWCVTVAGCKWTLKCVGMCRYPISCNKRNQRCVWNVTWYRYWFYSMWEHCFYRYFMEKLLVSVTTWNKLIQFRKQKKLIITHNVAYGPGLSLMDAKTVKWDCDSERAWIWEGGCGTRGLGWALERNGHGFQTQHSSGALICSLTLVTYLPCSWCLEYQSINTHYREFFEEIYSFRSWRTNLSLFPEGPKALKEISPQFVLKDIKLYIPETNSQ